MSDKYYQTKHVHPFCWDLVAHAIFLRYPNPMATHVLSEDTVHREVIQNGNVLYSRRFLTKTNKLPKWGERWMPSSIYKFVPLVEESHVDRNNKVVTTYTRNVGLSTFMTATEKVRYEPNPDNPDETIAIKEAWVESKLYGLRSAVKNFGVDRFKKNCVRATDGFNHVLNHLYQQQQYLSELKQRKSLEIKTKGEYAITQASIKANEKITKAADMVNTTKEKATDMVHSTKVKAADMVNNTKLKAAEKSANLVNCTKGQYQTHATKMNLSAEEK